MALFSEDSSCLPIKEPACADSGSLKVTIIPLWKAFQLQYCTSHFFHYWKKCNRLERREKNRMQEDVFCTCSICSPYSSAISFWQHPPPPTHTLLILSKTNTFILAKAFVNCSWLYWMHNGKSEYWLINYLICVGEILMLRVWEMNTMILILSIGKQFYFCRYYWDLIPETRL